MTLIVVPYDGDLETTGLVAHWVREGREVLAAALDTGRVPALDAAVCERRAVALGATRSIHLDLTAEVYSFATHLIRASGPESAATPLWLAAEDYALAAAALRLAREQKAALAVLPGRLRLGRVLGATAGDVELLVTQARDSAGWVAFLEAAGQEEQVPPRDDAANLRVRTSLWGNVASAELDGEEAHPTLPPPWEAADLPEEFSLSFCDGLPTEAFGKAVDGVNLFAQLTRTGTRHSVGRGVTTVDGEQIAWEGPATAILVAAHRALEQAQLDSRRLELKDGLAAAYRRMFAAGELHQGVARDLEAFLVSTQRGLSGTVHLELYRGVARVLAVESGS